MSKVVNTRIPEKDLKKLEKISQEEYLDKASLIRKWILEKIDEYNMKKQAEKYRLGLVSLAEAATNADVSIYEMMEFIEMHKYFPPEDNEAEIYKQYQEAIELVKLAKKKS